MDAHDWHQQATTAPTPWPDPLDPQTITALSATRRTAYLRRLGAALEGALVETDDTARVAAHLDAVVATNRLRPPGAMQMAALTAPYTAGKSTLVKQWAAALYRDAVGDQAREARPTWSPRPHITADLIPVVYVTLRAASTVKDVNAQLLLFLGYPPEGLARTTTTRVLHALKMHGVRLVIVDDAHMLRATNALGRQVLDYVKFLNTELGEQHGTVVLVGAHLETTTILDDPQIRGRLTLVTLAPYGIETTEQRRTWQRFLKAAEKRALPYLPGCDPGLFSRVLPEPTWQCTQGYVGDTTTLIARAVMDAVHDGRTDITPGHLDTVPLSERAVDARIDAAVRHRAGAGRASA